MKGADVVIGSNFGDEGKGLLVDALAAQAGGDALVVRYNGGAQAGHTVTLADGRRHVFSHFGAGTLAGAPTWLSRFFVAHPILFGREWAALAGLGVVPKVAIDPDAPVTTPHDMAVNQAVETARGAARHGSVGVGFGEALERGLRPDFALTVRDLADERLLRHRYREIGRRWLPQRLAALKVEPAHLPDLAALEDRWVTDCHRFLDAVQWAGPEILGKATHPIFEGAQGLLLDQDFGFFPHVTRSNTGLRNVAELAAAAGIAHLRVFRPTRAYLTRHGAGPLPGELPGTPWPGIIDPTNREHTYQGRLRFAWLDLDLMARAVAWDEAAAAGVKLETTAVVTCLDQVGAAVPVVLDGRRTTIAREDLPARVAAVLGGAAAAGSWGPTRAHLTPPHRLAGAGRHPRAAKASRLAKVTPIN